MRLGFAASEDTMKNFVTIKSCRTPKGPKDPIIRYSVFRIVVM